MNSLRLVKINDARYEFLCTYDERILPKSSGFWWDSSKRVWFTNNIAAAAKLARYSYGDVREDLVSIATKIDDNIKLSKAKDADIDVPCPDGLNYLSFQKAGIQFCTMRPRSLIGDEMGCGKTIQAIGVINYTNPKNVLVICPASLKINWKNELTKWLVDNYSIEIVEGSYTATPWSTIKIVNYDILGDRPDGKKVVLRHPELAVKYDLIIVDECHYVKNLKTIRMKALGLIIKEQDSDCRIIMMSGTPLLNRPIELFPVLKMLNSDLAKNYMTYIRRYCAAENNGFGMVVTGASNLDELQYKLRSTIMIRRLKEDVMDELPEKRRQLVSIPGDATEEEKKWWANYSRRRAKLLAEVAVARTISKEAYETAVRNLRYEMKIMFEDMSKIRHLSAIRKAPSAITYIKDLFESVDKIVIFAHHHDVIDMLVRGLANYNVVKIDGTDNPNNRQKAVDDFQNVPEIRGFIGSIRAAGTGFTLTASSNVVFVEFDWSPGVMFQAEDRCHRYGAKSSVLVHYLLVDDTIDSRLAKINTEKASIIDKALDSEVKDGMSEEIDAEVEVALREQVDSGWTTSESVRDKIRECLNVVANNNKFLSQFDENVIVSLAEARLLSDKQAQLGLKILSRYRDLLSEDRRAAIFGEGNE